MKTSINLNGTTAAGRARGRHRAFSFESLALTMQAMGMQRSEIRAELEQLQPARRWRVYYSDGEYARQLGDPLLGTVEAGTREEAERKGAALVTIAGPGVWVVEDGAPAKE